MNTQTIQNPGREQLLYELYELLTSVGEPISAIPGETPRDMVGAAGLSDQDLENLVQSYRTDLAERSNLQASPKKKKNPNVGGNFKKITPSKVSGC